MDEFQRQLAGLRQTMVDLDGDGIPDDVPANALSPRYQGEMRSSNTPLGDAVAPYVGTYGGALVSGFDRSMQGAIGDLKGYANSAYEMTGIPNALRGFEAAGAGAAQGDTIKQVGGIAQAGLSALPYAGPAAKAAFATAPRAMATVGAMGMAPVAAQGMFSEAKAQDPDADSKRLQQLYERQGAMQKQVQEATAERDRQAASGKGPKWRAADAKATEIQGQMQALDRQIETLNQRTSPEYLREQEVLRRKQEAGLPFRERYPELAGALPAAGMALAAGVPFALKGAQRLGSFVPGLGKPSRLNSATEAMEKAITNKDSVGIATRNAEINHLLKSESKGSKIKNALLAGGSGGLLAAEARMFPEQYDASMLPEGPQRDAAYKKMTDIRHYLESGAIGAMTGLSGYKAAGIIPERPMNVARARGAQAITRPEFSDDIEMIRQNLGAATRRLPPRSSPTNTPEPPRTPPAGPTQPPAPPSGGTASNNQGSAPAGIGQTGSGTTTGPGSTTNAGISSSRPAPLSKTAKKSILAKFAENNGTITVNELQKIAPKVPTEKLQAQVDALNKAWSDMGAEGFKKALPHITALGGIAGLAIMTRDTE